MAPEAWLPLLAEVRLESYLQGAHGLWREHIGGLRGDGAYTLFRAESWANCYNFSEQDWHMAYINARRGSAW